MCGGMQITSCWSRLKCGGCFACSQVDQKLLNVERYELDSTSRDRIFTAQRKTRQDEGNTPEKLIVMYVALLSTDVPYPLRYLNTMRAQKGEAVDGPYGQPCRGKPKLKERVGKTLAATHYCGKRVLFARNVQTLCQ